MFDKLWAGEAMTVEAVRLMSFNIRHGRGLDDKVDLGRIADVIENSGAQLVALQEVDRHNIRSRCMDQVKWLGKKLNMRWCFSRSMRFGVAQYGNATLSAFPICRRKVHLFPGIREYRSALQTLIDYDGRMIQVLNTHLSVFDEERRGQFMLLVKTLRNLHNVPTILLGDFNMEYDNPLFKRLDPCWQRIAPSRKTETVAGGKEIDHIFVNRPAWGFKADVIKTTSSDHHAVVADIPLDMLH